MHARIFPVCLAPIGTLAFAQGEPGGDAIPIHSTSVPL